MTELGADHSLKPVGEVDPEIAQVLEDEARRQESTLEMIASENFVPQAILDCQAKTVTATFIVPRTLSVTKAGAGSGTVTSAPEGIDCGTDCTQDYANGTSVTLTANPGGGSTFTGFTGAGCSGSGTTCTVTMDQAQSVTATFALVPRALSVAKAGNGFGDGHERSGGDRLRR